MIVIDIGKDPHTPLLQALYYAEGPRSELGESLMGRGHQLAKHGYLPLYCGEHLLRGQFRREVDYLDVVPDSVELAHRRKDPVPGIGFI
ncbi:MAG TPA: hypothetical protein VD839_17050 [Burkholderiales bacterium]|nr:hypothetical protein [Burkholderiales bacterium]